MPQMTVSLINRIDLAFARALHIHIGQNKLANAWIVCEPADTVAQTKHNHGGRAVETITGSDHILARLQHIAQLRGTFAGLAALMKVKQNKQTQSPIELD